MKQRLSKLLAKFQAFSSNKPIVEGKSRCITGVACRFLSNSPCSTIHGMTDSLIRRLTPPRVIYCCAHCSKMAKVLSTISHNHSHEYFLVWPGSVKPRNCCPAKLQAIRYYSHCMQLQPSVSHHNSEAIIHIPIEVLSQTTSTSCRPDWSRCAKYVEGGMPWWAELSDS